ncbi:MAG: polynucleotide adenylyltransferase PcnB [Methylococcales bacterium]|jgi:poly(A) polymerase|nr:polynucleotide adenylyltransferase PcnB [Methylococcales bacterium]MBT7443047.1 polynucleotide adenylyltransferase PcnB [Methylococcales bacterium]
MMIIARPDHNISRNSISPHALKVLYRLKNAGYEAYLVGGGVRDVLLGKQPKDFDIATNAHPEDVSRVFRNCRLIGRRFRLAHVYFGREIIEVATFRGSGNDDGLRETNQEGRILHDNVYGTLEEDAERRDFTINALYYNISDFSIVDFSTGYQDIADAQLRLIGDPETRFREDPVRMIRAIRFAAKLDFIIEDQCVEPIKTLGGLLLDVPPARMFDEVLKLFLHGHALASFHLLREYKLYDYLFPASKDNIDEDPQLRAFLEKAMRNTDVRVNAGKPVTPAFLFAVFLWAGAKQVATGKTEHLGSWIESIQLACDATVKQQQKHTAIPKRVIHPMREIWTMQPRFFQRTGKRPLRLLSHPKFRAGYDFFLLRSQVGEVDPEVAKWWTDLQVASEAEQRKMVAPKHTQRKKKAKPKSESTAPEEHDD